MGKSEVSNSFRLSSSIPMLWPFAAGRGFVTRQVDRLGLGWWRNNHLMKYRKRHLRKLLSGAAFAYVAPLQCSEATRCREIVESLACPFVVHIWDLIEPELTSDYRWLFCRAEHIFCLSSSMTNVVCEAGGRKVSQLAFVRPASTYRAKPVDGDRLVIGLVGFLSAYHDGLKTLSEAIAGLRQKFSEVHVRYIGPPAQLQFIPDEMRKITEYIGFTNDDARDKALAGCHIGFLPGPMLSPQQDSRSRFSVPSRSADYMAVGLPMVAAVHPLSATSAFFAPIGDKGFYLANTPQEMHDTVEALRQEEAWTHAARECLLFFDRHCNKENAQKELLSVVGRLL